MIDGERVKQWKHILPRHHNSLSWTYTDSPLSAIVILNLMFNAPTVQTVWRVPTNGYHPLQLAPAYDIDCYNGKTLQAALQEVSDKHGLTMGLQSTADSPYRLVWIRKGEGFLPTYANGQPSPLNVFR